jgi:hypothetical protein
MQLAALIGGRLLGCRNAQINGDPLGDPLALRSGHLIPVSTARPTSRKAAKTPTPASPEFPRVFGTLAQERPGVRAYRLGCTTSGKRLNASRFTASPMSQPVRRGYCDETNAVEAAGRER